MENGCDVGDTGYHLGWLVGLWFNPFLPGNL